MNRSDNLRQQIDRLLGWSDAHVDFDAAVAGLPPEFRGVTPLRLPYSPWQLVEHMRLTQTDILAFCTRTDYREPIWPDDYWPATPEPSDAEAWDASIAAFRRDRAALQRMINDQTCDLFAKVPAGTGETFLREFLLAADHTAYHVGQLVAVRRALGQWPAA